MPKAPPPEIPKYAKVIEGFYMVFHGFPLCSVLRVSSLFSSRVFKSVIFMNFRVFRVSSERPILSVYLKGFQHGSEGPGEPVLRVPEVPRTMVFNRSEPQRGSGLNMSCRFPLGTP